MTVSNCCSYSSTASADRVTGIVRAADKTSVAETARDNLKTAAVAPSAETPPTGAVNALGALLAAGLEEGQQTPAHPQTVALAYKSADQAVE